MKKIPLLFLALCILPLHQVSANIEEVDVTDYFDFEVGTWWNYKITNFFPTQNIYDELSYTKTQLECNDGAHETCYSIEDLHGVTNYFIENNVAYYSQINDENLSSDYVRMNPSGYEINISESDYEQFALDGFDSGAQITCSYQTDDGYSYYSYSNTALLEDCVLTAESSEGQTLEVTKSTVLIAGLAEYSSTSSVYIDGELLQVQTSTLTSTSLIDDDDSPFSDVSEFAINYLAIKFLYDNSIVTGYADGTFGPDNTINRAELLKVLVEGQGVTPSEEIYRDCFPDVSNEWFAKYICYAKESGWISGYPDGTFQPGNAVNKVEALKMLLESQNIPLSEEWTVEFWDISESDWFGPYIQTASELGLLEEEGGYFLPGEERNRKGLAENLYRLLRHLDY